MDYWRREQVGAATGTVAVVLMGVAAVFAGTYPHPAASGPTVLKFLAQNRTEILVQTFLFGIASIFGLWFLGSLRGVLRRAEGGTGRVAGIAYAGGIGAVAMMGVSLLFIVNSAYFIERFVASGNTALPVAFFGLGQLASAFVMFPLALMFGAASLVVMRTDILPRWVAYLGFLATAISIAGAASLFYRTGSIAPGGSLAFYVPLAATMLWFLVTSLLLTAKLGTPKETTVARRRIGDIPMRADAPQFTERRQRTADQKQ